MWMQIAFEKDPYESSDNKNDDMEAYGSLAGSTRHTL